MWREIPECTQKLAKETLRVFKKGGERMNGAWLWNDEVKEKVKAKQGAHNALLSSATKVESNESNRNGKEQYL